MTRRRRLHFLGLRRRRSRPTARSRIADAAVAAGLAEAPSSEHDAYRFSSVLRAKLADLSVDKITEVNGEQTDSAEAFVAASAT